MQVYIEDAFINSFIINFVILFLTQFSLRQRIAKVKTILTAAFCSILPMILQYFVPGLYDFWLLKIILGLLMCAFLQQKFVFKSYFLFFLVFLSITFLLGGFCFFVLFLINGSKSIMQNNLPVDFGLIVLLVGGYTYFLINVIRHFYNKQKIEQFYYDIKIEFGGKSCTVRAYVDSGNFLKDVNTNMPIAIISLKSFLKLLNDKSLVFNLLKCNLDSVVDGKYIDFYSVNSKNKVFVFKPDKIVDVSLKNKKLNFLIGVGLNNFKNQDFDLLLSPLCF